MAASLRDKLNPDAWMKSGGMLLDYPLPCTTESRKFASLALGDDPQLSAHFARWLCEIDQFDARAEKFGKERTEGTLRMMWERARIATPQAIYQE